MRVVRAYRAQSGGILRKLCAVVTLLGENVEMERETIARSQVIEIDSAGGKTQVGFVIHSAAK